MTYTRIYTGQPRLRGMPRGSEPCIVTSAEAGDEDFESYGAQTIETHDIAQTGVGNPTTTTITETEFDGFHLTTSEVSRSNVDTRMFVMIADDTEALVPASWTTDGDGVFLTRKSLPGLTQNNLFGIDFTYGIQACGGLLYIGTVDPGQMISFSYDVFLLTVSDFGSDYTDLVSIHDTAGNVVESDGHYEFVTPELIETFTYDLVVPSNGAYLRFNLLIPAALAFVIDNINIEII